MYIHTYDTYTYTHIYIYIIIYSQHKNNAFIYVENKLKELQ